MTFWFEIEGSINTSFVLWGLNFSFSIGLDLGLHDIVFTFVSSIPIFPLFSPALAVLYRFSCSASLLRSFWNQLPNQWMKKAVGDSSRYPPLSRRSNSFLPHEQTMASKLEAHFYKHLRTSACLSVCSFVIKLKWTNYVSSGGFKPKTVELELFSLEWISSTCNRHSCFTNISCLIF